MITANQSMGLEPCGGQRTLGLLTKQHVGGFGKELYSTQHKTQASKNSITHQILYSGRGKIPETTFSSKKEAAMKHHKPTSLLFLSNNWGLKDKCGVISIPTVQFSSVAQLCPTLCDPMNCSTPGLPVHHQLPEFTQTHTHRVGDAIQPFHPLLSSFPPAPNPSQYQSLFQWVNSSLRWPKYWSFSFSISPLNERPGLISFRMDWLDLLAFQRTLKSLLQYHSSKASIFRCSAFFTVQLSHPYMTTGKTIALTKRTFVGKVMSLLFSMLSRLVITFLPRSKHLLVSWLNHHLQWFWSSPK